MFMPKRRFYVRHLLRVNNFSVLDETAATATVELDGRFPLCQVTYHRGQRGSVGKLATVEFLADHVQEDKPRTQVVEARLREVLPEFLHQLLLTELEMLEQEEYYAEEGYVLDEKPSQLTWELPI